MSKCLMARVIEGTDKWFNHVVSDGKHHEFIPKDNATVCVTAPCSQEGFNSLYTIGKQLWDSNMCSKFEISAFDDGEMFWKTRPDQWNFERGRYNGWFDSMIAEELKSFRSEDFQNDPLEMQYVTDYQKRFWDVKTDFYTVNAFMSLIKDTKLYEDFNLIRDWINKMEAEVSLEALSNMSFIPRECGFSYNGQWILNPFYDETLRFGVEPFRYYGEENIKGYVERIKLIIFDNAREPLTEQIDSAQTLKSRVEKTINKSINQENIERE